MSSIGYRPDIDGLRGIAVLAVILFHAGLTSFSGGYVGVDVFFVISGFLITSILLREVRSGQFSFRSFYIRRARRLLPALFLTLAATLVAGLFLLLPSEMVALGKATLATLFFSSNIYFWDKKSTYFGLDVETEPLLHTWSLGVEEQFYIFFPLLLLFIFRISRGHNRKIFLLLALITSASLLANLLLTPFYTKFSFYMISNRAWELLAGALLALPIIPMIKSPRAASLLALTGALLLILAVFGLKENSVFPGYNALLPVMAAALIIHTGKNHQALVHRLLRIRPIWFCGLISYSLYLWHWPITVYINMLWESAWSPAIIISLSLGLAFLSWRFVEQRYHRSPGTDGPQKNRQPKTELATLGILVFVFSLGIVLAQGLPSRIEDKVYADAGIPRNDSVRKRFLQSCKSISELLPDSSGIEGRRCPLGAQNGPPEFVLWGDSHARALAPAFNQAALELGISGWLFNQSGCRTLLGVYRDGKYDCRNFNKTVANLIDQTPSIQSIFIAGYWRVPLMGKSYDNNNFLIMDEMTETLSPKENIRVFGRGLRRSLEHFPGRSVNMIEDVPEVGSSFGKEVANHFLRAVWLDSGLTPKQWVLKDSTDNYDYVLQNIRESLPKLQWVTVKDRLCQSESCPLYQNGNLLYADGDHLSHAGAMRLKTKLKEILAAGQTGRTRKH